MGDLFARERELCMLFKQNRQSDRVLIDYAISIKSVDVLAYYKNKADWDVQDGRQDFNRLWRNFNLAYIGYKTECVILNYVDFLNNYVTEHFFPMKLFNIDNFRSKEFEKYDPKY